MLQWFSKSFQAIEMRPSQGGGTTSEKTEQFCQIFGSAPQDKASGQDIQRDHQPVGNILSFEDLHQFISRLLKPGISGLQGQ